MYNERRLLRTFLGHGKAVRDISFNNDGSKFLSCSYDRYIKLWDTETGEYVKTSIIILQLKHYTHHQSSRLAVSVV